MAGDQAVPRTRITPLVREVRSVAPDTIVRNVKRLLEGESPTASIVVTHDDRPIGQVVGYELDHQLSTEFGRSLYWLRPVAYVMNDDPLVVDSDTPLEEVARAAMARHDDQLYHDIIVVGDGKLLGTVSVQQLLSAFAKAEGVLEIAGTVCHEMNQPLQIIQGYAEYALREKKGLDACAAEALQTISQEVDRITQITQRLQRITSFETRDYVPGSRIIDLHEASE